ncbi:MAG: hypothetical protein ACP5E3_10055 [Bacteroidales bacterium]
MRNFLIILFLFFINGLYGQTSSRLSENVVSREDFYFLEEMTQDVLESSRIYPGQVVSSDFGANNTNGTLIRPGGRDCYPSFWIRDYAMSLESGLIPLEEQKHMLQLTADTQCDQAWITRGGSMVPLGAIADHVRVDDGLPIYFPGTYSYEGQGTPDWGIFPPICDQFFFIHMAYNFIKESSDEEYLLKEINGVSLLNRLEIAFHVSASHNETHVVYTTDNLRAVDFGFRDAIVITGDLCFPSILKYRASNELAWLFDQVNRKQKAEKYRDIASKLKKSIPDLFSDDRGMLRASTGKSQQPAVWSTALAVYLGVFEGEALIKASQFLAHSYLNGTLSYKGNIRHILTSDDYSNKTAWEISHVQKNTYQNGAYWGTPTGWVAYAIAITKPDLARKLAGEYIEELRENDYRKGPDYGAPWECFHPNGHRQNPVYLTSVTCPYAVFKKLIFK